MKLTGQLNAAQLFANSNNDYLFDIHIAQKHNASKMDAFAIDLTQYFKQNQSNELVVNNTDTDGSSVQDDNLITVVKVGLVYTITTSYKKVFSSALCYDSTGELQPSAIKVTFTDDGSGGDNRESMIVTFQNPITTTFRVVLS
jgi:hypothetical protein